MANDIDFKLPDFLSGEQATLPTGGDFVPSGFIGAFKAQILWSFYAKVDLVSDEYAGTPEPDFRKKMGDGWRYYYADHDAANAAREAAGIEINPSQKWLFAAQKANVLNIASENLDKFSDPVSFDLDVRSFKSGDLHQFQLIALPMAVAAIADLMGFKTSGFDISELLTQDTIFDDDFAAKMLGPSLNVAKGVKFDFAQGELFKRRAQLWAELGETDPMKYTFATKTAKSPRTDTTSQKLAACLAVAAPTWKQPMYLKLVNASLPKVDDAYEKNGELVRKTIPVIAKFYKNKAEADLDAQADKDRQANNAAKKAHNGSNGDTPINVAVPVQWVDFPDDWKNAVKAAKEKIGPQVVAKPAILRELTTYVANEPTVKGTCTPQEMLAWWDKV